MFLEDEERIGKSDLFQKPSDDDLAKLSLEELEYRVKWLEEERDRTQALIKSKAGALSEAESFFKK